MLQGVINAHITKNRHDKQWLVRFTEKLTDSQREAARGHLKTILMIEKRGKNKK